MHAWNGENKKNLSGYLANEHVKMLASFNISNEIGSNMGASEYERELHSPKPALLFFFLLFSTETCTIAILTPNIKKEKYSLNGHLFYVTHVNTNQN